jgi:hypothetical protein
MSIQKPDKPGKPCCSKTKVRLTPYAFAKARFIRDLEDLEVSGYCITSKDDPLLIQDFMLVKQEVGPASIDMDGDSIGEFYERMVELGYQPCEFARIWMHTHPGTSPNPSGTDEETFKKHFSDPDWSVMLILAKGGAWYARLRFNIGPGGSMEVPVEIDWDEEFPESNQAEWFREYELNVTERKVIVRPFAHPNAATWPPDKKQSQSRPINGQKWDHAKRRMVPVDDWRDEWFKYAACGDEQDETKSIHQQATHCRWCNMPLDTTCTDGECHDCKLFFEGDPEELTLQEKT